MRNIRGHHGDATGMSGARCRTLLPRTSENFYFPRTWVNRAKKEAHKVSWQAGRTPLRERLEGVQKSLLFGELFQPTVQPPILVAKAGSTCFIVGST